MKQILETEEFLPLASIKSISVDKRRVYERVSVIGEIISDDKKFKKTASKHLKHKKAINIVKEEEEDYREGDTDMDEGEGYAEKDENIVEQSNMITNILCKLDLQPGDWIAINMVSAWHPAQFIAYDGEQEELQVNFLHRSTSNPKWFIWPQVNGQEDKVVGS